MSLLPLPLESLDNGQKSILLLRFFGLPCPFLFTTIRPSLVECVVLTLPFLSSLFLFLPLLLLLVDIQPLHDLHRIHAIDVGRGAMLLQGPCVLLKERVAIRKRSGRS